MKTAMLLRKQPTPRLNLLFLALVLSVVSFCYIWPRLLVDRAIGAVWTPKQQKQIVVFGDSFSDLGVARSLRKSRKGKGSIGGDWIRALCDETACNSISNFASTAPKTDPTSTSERLPRLGAALLNEAYTNGTEIANHPEASLLPDLHAQVQQWLSSEAHQTAATDELVFTAFFGLHDIWAFADLPLKEGMSAISNSIFSLFEQLDVLAKDLNKGPIKVVLPAVWDLTFEPRYLHGVQVDLNDPVQTSTTADPTEAASAEADLPPLTPWQTTRLPLPEPLPKSVYPHNQRKAVTLVSWWNIVLKTMAQKWPRGKVYMPAWDMWVMDRIRERQMMDLGIDRAPQEDTGGVFFTMVDQGCLDWDIGSVRPSSEPCAEPEKWLFWDDMHLSTAAQHVLGRHVAQLLRTGETINAGAILNLNPEVANERVTKVPWFRTGMPPGF